MDQIHPLRLYEECAGGEAPLKVEHLFIINCYDLFTKHTRPPPQLIAKRSSQFGYTGVLHQLKSLYAPAEEKASSGVNVTMLRTPLHVTGDNV